MEETPEVVIDESLEINLDEQDVDLTAEIIIEEEPAMYVVADYSKSEIFSAYIVIILAVLITYPIMRVIIKAGKGVKIWR